MTAAERIEEPELVECDLECRCGSACTMALPGDEPVRATLAALECPSCSRKGTMTLVPSVASPRTKDPDDGGL